MRMKNIISAVTALTLLSGIAAGMPAEFCNSTGLSYINTASAEDEPYSRDTEGFVTRMYDIVLGRKPDSVGFKNWTDKLNNHSATAADIITGFFFSAEYTGKKKSNEEMVTDCYSALLDRTPDSAGMESWRKRLDTGMSVQSVCKGFVGSSEFRNLCSAYGIEHGDVTLKYSRDDNYELTNFVYRLYKNCLGRTPDTAGLENWCAKLKNGMTGSQIAYGFIFSSEYKEKEASDEQYVTMLYETLLGRAGDSSGMINWIKKLQGDSTREDVLRGFLQSSEFKGQCSKAGIEPGRSFYGELFEKYYSKAEADLKNMSLEDKISQMFLIGYPGYSTALDQVSSSEPGGYVLFAADFQYHTKDSIRTQLNTLKSRSKHNLFLGADEEGGSIVRVSKFKNFRSSVFPSPQELYKKGGLELIYSDAAEKAALLKDIGLNYNLAPVVDMPRNSSSYIYNRTLGQNAQITGEFAAGVTKVMNSSDMMACLKHFPGYGDNLDTHSLVSVDSRSREKFDSEDLIPFKKGIEAGVPMVMVNHNIISCMDPSRPASLSAEVHRVLREDLGFTGLILTDSLSMGAVKKYTSDGESAVQAVLCGNDMIVTTDYQAQKNEVLRAARNGRIPENMIDDAVRRILACKYYYGLK